MVWRRWHAPLAGGLTGLLLFVADHPVHAFPLELIAFVPLLWALSRAPRARWAAAAGAATGVVYTGALAVVLEFPALMGGALALVLSLMWVLAALGAWRVWRWPQPLGALAAAAVFVLVEWASYTAIPVWGTAQCFARVWSAAPDAIAFVRLTGIAGLVFVLVGVAALGVAAWQAHGRARQLTLAALALLVLLPMAAALERPPEYGHSGIRRVATVGWTRANLRDPNDARAVLDEAIIPAIVEAAGRRAQLLVSPEVGLPIAAGDLDALTRELGALAAEHRITLAIGIWDDAARQNRILFFTPDGQLAGSYSKTHLIMMLERYVAGDGTLVTVPFAQGLLGGMICQDDNFTDLARGYGRRGAQVVAVPTNDWRQVAPYHLENALLRGIENGYAIVRAASNGTSVIATARGHVLAQSDHFTDGKRVLVADLPLEREPAGTFYSRNGEWLPALCGLLLVVGAALELRRRRAATRS